MNYAAIDKQSLRLVWLFYMVQITDYQFAYNLHYVKCCYSININDTTMFALRHNE